MPAIISMQPKQSKKLRQVDEASIKIPEMMPVTTETLPFWINLTVIVKVTSINKLQMIRIPQSLRLRLFIGEAANTKGSSIEQLKLISWTIEYSFDNFNFDISVLTNPNRIPGISYRNLVIVQFFQRRIDPIIMAAKKYLKTPRRLPLQFSHKMANRIPPEPFHPMKILQIIPIKTIPQDIFNLQSLFASGRKVLNSYFLIMATQLTRKENRKVMNKYCKAGKWKNYMIFMCSIIKTSAAINRVSVVQ